MRTRTLAQTEHDLRHNQNTNSGTIRAQTPTHQDMNSGATRTWASAQPEHDLEYQHYSGTRILRRRETHELWRNQDMTSDATRTRTSEHKLHEKQDVNDDIPFLWVILTCFMATHTFLMGGGGSLETAKLKIPPPAIIPLCTDFLFYTLYTLFVHTLKK